MRFLNKKEHCPSCGVHFDCNRAWADNIERLHTALECSRNSLDGIESPRERLLDMNKQLRCCGMAAQWLLTETVDQLTVLANANKRTDEELGNALLFAAETEGAVHNRNGVPRFIVSDILRLIVRDDRDFVKSLIIFASLWAEDFQGRRLDFCLSQCTCVYATPLWCQIVMDARKAGYLQ